MGSGETRDRSSLKELIMTSRIAAALLLVLAIGVGARAESLAGDDQQSKPAADAKQVATQETTADRPAPTPPAPERKPDEPNPKTPPPTPERKPDTPKPPMPVPTPEPGPDAPKPAQPQPTPEPTRQ